MPKIKAPLEHDECVAFVELLQLKRLLFSHIHHETYTPYENQKKLMKELGVMPGVPDYIIFVSKEQSSVDRPLLIFIEMKRVSGGTVSPAQQTWIDSLHQVKDVGAFVCYGFDEAKEVIDEYVK